MSGQPRPPEISRHIHQPAPPPTPDQARCLQRRGPNRAQRCDPSGPPERACDALDSKSPRPCGAASGAPGPGDGHERGSRPGWVVYGDSREGWCSQSVELSDLEGAVRDCNVRSTGDVELDWSARGHWRLPDEHFDSCSILQSRLDQRSDPLGFPTCNSQNECL